MAALIFEIQFFGLHLMLLGIFNYSIITLFIFSIFSFIGLFVMWIVKLKLRAQPEIEWHGKPAALAAAIF